jgi:hypothetical protein
MVSSVGCGAECECEDVAQTVEITILFRRMHSEDVKSAFKNGLCIQLSCLQLYSMAHQQCLLTAEPCT